MSGWRLAGRELDPLGESQLTGGLAHCLNAFKQLE